ncbi:TPA: helix-turn-helix domain-containing protein [Serratia marcescens]
MALFNMFSMGVLDDVLHIIEDKINAHNSVSIKELSSISGYSAGHLQRVFHVYSGMNLGTYIRRRRLSRSALFLKLSDLKIYEIAFLSGFSSQQSYSRAFCEQFGRPPAAFRISCNWPFSNYQRAFGEGLDNVSLKHLSDHELSDQERVSNFTQMLIPSMNDTTMSVTYPVFNGFCLNDGEKNIKFTLNAPRVCDRWLAFLVYDKILPTLNAVVGRNVILKVKDDNTLHGEGFYYIVPLIDFNASKFY